MYDLPEDFSFEFQIAALSSKIRQLKQFANRSKLTERSILAQLKVFVPVLKENEAISDLQLELLEEMCEIGLEIPYMNPDIYIYLYAEPEVVFDRIKSRGRIEEKNITLFYLQQLHEKYEQWMWSEEMINKCIVVDMNKKGHVDLDFEKISQQIERHNELYIPKLLL